MFVGGRPKSLEIFKRIKISIPENEAIDSL